MVKGQRKLLKSSVFTGGVAVSLLVANHVLEHCCIVRAVHVAITLTMNFLQSYFEGVLCIEPALSISSS